MTIRVLRLLEYEYADLPTAQRDMAGWEVQGTRRFNLREIVRSTVLTGYPGAIDGQTILEPESESTPG